MKITWLKFLSLCVISSLLTVGQVTPAAALTPCNMAIYKVYVPYLSYGPTPLDDSQATDAVNSEGKRRQNKPRSDFNNDGCADLAIGAPGRDYAIFIPGPPPGQVRVESVGATNVMYGDTTSFFASEQTYLTQDRAGGSMVAGDSFGNLFMIGDFNGDSYDDLAIGVPFEDVGGNKDAGAVNIVYGSANGLNASIAPQEWTQSKNGLPDTPEAGDWFGASLAAGDFNGDGFDDLAIGAPTEDIESTQVAGSMIILYGTSSGLSSIDSQVWTETSPQGGNAFGAALSAGDFNRDGYADLAASATGTDVDATIDAGVVKIVYGSASGLQLADSQQQTFTQADAGGVPEAGDMFSTTLANGDINGDTYVDLILGTPLEEINGFIHAGAINILYGSSVGLTSSGSQEFSQGSPAMLGGLGNENQWGIGLSAGDYNNDGYEDVSVGAPSQDVESATDAGAVNILFGSAAGLSTTNNQWLTQNDFGGAAESDDRFGFSIASADYNGDGFDDLAVGAPYEDNDTIVNIGAVYTSPGGPSGIMTVGGKEWLLASGAQDDLYGWQFGVQTNQLLTAEQSQESQ